MSGTDRELLAEALAAVPGLVGTEAALEVAKQYLAAARVAQSRAGSQVPGVIEDVARIVLEGGAVPQDFGQRYADAFEAARRLADERQAAELLVTRMDNALESITHAGLDPALELLAGRLEALLERAAPVIEATAGARTAEDVVSAGGNVLESWQQMADIGREYAAIRSAQQNLTRREAKERGGEDRTEIVQALQLVGEIQNADQFRPWDPQNLPWKSNQPPPWPTGPVQFILWAHDHGAELWLPTIDELLAQAERYRNPGRDLEAPAPGPGTLSVGAKP